MPTTARTKKKAPISRGCNELKWWDTLVNSQNVGVYSPYTTFSQSLNLVPAGSSGDNRVGRKIIVRSIQATFHLYHANQAGANPSNDHFIRIMIVSDRQNNGTVVVPDDVVSTARGFTELANRERFTILKSYTIPFDSRPTYNGTTITAQGIRQVLHHYQKINLPILFAEDTPLITDVTSNNLLVLAWSDTSTHFELQMSARIRFND
jgi:hypothetical protein